MSEQSVTLHQKTFRRYISNVEIEERVQQIAKQISADHQGQELLVLGVLDGAFMFLADLLKRVDADVEVEMIKLKSYDGLESTGAVKAILGPPETLQGKNVLILEDIIDTGRTLSYLLDHIGKKAPKSVKIATLLLKEVVFKDKFPIHYHGFSIPDKFVVGYGMDYNGKGRQLKDIYVLNS